MKLKQRASQRESYNPEGVGAVINNKWNKETEAE